MLTLYAHDSFCMSNIAASFILLYVPMILNNAIQSKNIQSWKTVVFSFHLVWKNILRYQRSNDKYSDGLGGYYTCLENMARKNLKLCFSDPPGWELFPTHPIQKPFPAVPIKASDPLL